MMRCFEQNGGLGMMVVVVFMHGELFKHGQLHDDMV